MNASLITTEQSAIIGIIAILLSQVIILAMSKMQDKKLGKAIATIIVFVVSFALAYAWSGIQIVLSTENPMEAANQLLQAALQVAGAATGIYNLLLSSIFDKVGWTQEAVAPSLKTVPQA